MKNGPRKILSLLGAAVLLIVVWVLKEEIEEEAWWRGKKFIQTTDGPHCS